MPDPNGISWDDWKAAGYASYDAWIDSKAGACPPVMSARRATPEPTHVCHRCGETITYGAHARSCRDENGLSNQQRLHTSVSARRATPEDHPRPVWLTRQQRSALGALLSSPDSPSGRIALRATVAAWDAAPADPAEAVKRALDVWHHEYGEGTVDEIVLVALGLPRQEQA
jgi:hypothetical protein